MVTLLDSGESVPDTPPRRHVLRSLTTIALIVVLLAVAAALGSGLWMQQHFGGQIERLPDAMPTDVDRPAPTPGQAMTVLLLGSDKRADGSLAGQRSDTMMVVRIAADREAVTVVSIPRDSWVTIPGHGSDKINAAFAYGGTALAVRTIENLTGLRMDHVAVIDWEGFKALTDALGGVTLTVPQTVTDGYSGRTWQAGEHELDGESALAYVRQRAGLPGGDFDRIHRQQYFLRELMHQTLSSSTALNPVRAYKVLDAVTANLAVDEDWTTAQLRDFALSLRSLRPSGVTFTTVPVKGTGMEGAASVVYLDRQTGTELWSAVADGSSAQWVADRGAGLGDEVS